MSVFFLIMLTIAAVGEVEEDQRGPLNDVFYCVMDAAADAIGIPPLRHPEYVPVGNELRVWISRGREADLLFRVSKQRGGVVAQFVAFEEALGSGIPGRHCSVLGVDVGVTLLNAHAVSLTERSPILHNLLVNGAWTLGSSETEVTVGNSMSLILERFNKGHYSIDAHDNPEIADGQDEAAACEIIRVLDEYAAKNGIKFKPHSCTVRFGALDPNYRLNLTVHPATALAGARSAPGRPAG